MNRDDIIRMARQAGFETLLPHEHIHGTGGVYVGDDDIAVMLERFAALVASAEREACAERTGEFARKWWSIHCASNKYMETTRKAHDDFCALQSAIRARGEK